jgi:hypothetical protein
VGASLILFFRRRAPGPSRSAGPQHLITQYPIESVVVAAAAGFFVAQSEDVRVMLMRELLRMSPHRGG